MCEWEHELPPSLPRFHLRIWFSKSWQNCEQGTQTHLSLIVVISVIEIYVYILYICISWNILKNLWHVLKYLGSWTKPPKTKASKKPFEKTHHLEFIIHFQSNCDDPQNLEKQTSKFQKNPPESLRILSLPIGLGSPSGDGVPITGARKSLTTTTPKDDAGNVWISKFSRCWKMWKLEQHKQNCVKDMKILLGLTSCQYVWWRINGTMWLFLTPFNVGEVGDVRVMYQHKPQDECLEQRNLGSNNRTTPQQMGP